MRKSITKSPGAAYNEPTFGSIPWETPMMVLTKDGATANANFNMSAGAFGPPMSNYLVARQFGFEIPENATIEGITADIRCVKHGMSPGMDCAVKLEKAGWVGGDFRNILEPWPTVLEYRRHGGHNDLWGGTWTPADINHYGFGVAIAASTSMGTALSIDHVLVTITYSEPDQD